MLNNVGNAYNNYIQTCMYCACNYNKKCEEKYSPKYSQLFFQVDRITCD